MSTETVDPRYVGIDSWPMATAVEAMLEGQLAALAAVKQSAVAIAAAAEAAAARLGETGRLVYAGAGTSGRIAVQDGVELYPTYNWPQARLAFLMAGGLSALTEAAEGAEDDAVKGRAEAEALKLTAQDVVIGVAASGRTPYTVAVLEAGRAAGALTIGVANNPDTPVLATADHALLAETGTEIVAGSTRMKAGTAQKTVLNLLSTAIMLRKGLVYRGRMVNMRVSNDKLRARGATIVADLAGVDVATGRAALEAAQFEIKQGVLIASGLAPDEGRALLAGHGGNLRAALGAYLKQEPADA